VVCLALNTKFRRSISQVNTSDPFPGLIRPFGVHLSCCHGMGKLGGPDESPISSLSPIARARRTPKVLAHRRCNISRNRPGINSSSYLFRSLCSLFATSCASASGNGGPTDCLHWDLAAPDYQRPLQAIIRDKATPPFYQPIISLFFLLFQLHICGFQIANDPQITAGDTTIFT
jgi:hypothetical protein